jgi:hypothetical protein
VEQNYTLLENPPFSKGGSKTFTKGWFYFGSKSLILFWLQKFDSILASKVDSILAPKG